MGGWKVLGEKELDWSLLEEDQMGLNKVLGCVGDNIAIDECSPVLLHLVIN